MTSTTAQTLETDSDREHCRLDLDAIQTHAQAAVFLNRWRHALRDFLIDPPDPPGLDEERDEWAKREKELETALNSVDHELRRTVTHLEDALLRLEEIEADDNCAGRIATDLQALADRLAKVRSDLEEV